MKSSHYVVILDTCVLAPMPVADTLIRLAEEPAFYIPRWSKHILEELGRTLLKFGYTQGQVDRRIAAMTAAFPDAAVPGYESLIDAMTNHPRDRHVLAAAVHCGAHAIVSNNVKHFPKDSLSPFGMECLSANEFLKHQYHLNPDGFINVLRRQARRTDRTLQKLIACHVPCLSGLIHPLEEDPEAEGDQ